MAKAATVHLDTRVTVEANNELQRYVNATNWSKAAVLRLALDEFLQRRSKFGLDEEVRAVERRIADYEIEINRLNNQLSELIAMRDEAPVMESSYPVAKNVIESILREGNLVEQDFLIQSRKCGMTVEDFKQQLRNDGVITDENE